MNNAPTHLSSLTPEFKRSFLKQYRRSTGKGFIRQVARNLDVNHSLVVRVWAQRGQAVSQRVQTALEEGVLRFIAKNPITTETEGR